MSLGFMILYLPNQTLRFEPCHLVSHSGRPATAIACVRPPNGAAAALFPSPARACEPCALRPKLRVLAMLCAWLCIGASCAGVFAGGLRVLLAARLPCLTSTQPLRPSALARGMSQASATSSPPLRSALRLRALHRAEDIGSALKGGVNVRQRQLVKEVLKPLVTEFVR